MLWSVDDERDDDLLALRHPYFETLEPLRSEGQHSYAGGDALTENTVNYEWNHGLGEVVAVVIDAGMRLEFLHEHTFADYQGLQSTVRGGEGRWRLPDRPERLPLMFSLRARLDRKS